MDYVHITFASPVCVRMSYEGQDSLAESIKPKSSLPESNPANHFSIEAILEEGCSKRGSRPARREFEGSTRVAPTRQGATCKGLKSCIDMTQSDGALY